MKPYLVAQDEKRKTEKSGPVCFAVFWMRLKKTIVIDQSVTDVTIDELKQARILAIQAVGNLVMVDAAL